MEIASIVRILELVFLAVLALLSIALCVIKMVRAIRTKQIVNSDESIQMDNDTTLTKLKAIEDNLLGYMEVAESTYSTFKNLAQNAGISSKFGATKLSDVLGKIRSDCLTSGVEYDNSYWEDKVNRLVSFSKKVNVR